MAEGNEQSVKTDRYTIDKVYVLPWYSRHALNWPAFGGSTRKYVIMSPFPLTLISPLHLFGIKKNDLKWFLSEIKKNNSAMKKSPKPKLKMRPLQAVDNLLRALYFTWNTCRVHSASDLFGTKWKVCYKCHWSITESDSTYVHRISPNIVLWLAGSNHAGNNLCTRFCIQRKKIVKHLSLTFESSCMETGCYLTGPILIPVWHKEIS